MGGCLWGLQTAPLSRLHDRLIEPIENIVFFDLPSRILRCSEYEHFLLWLSSKKMKCFQKVGDAYFISLSLFWWFPAAFRSEMDLSAGIMAEISTNRGCTVRKQGLYAIASAAKQSVFIRLPRRSRPAAVTPRGDICFVRLIPCGSLQDGSFQAGSSTDADFMHFLRKDYTRS